MRKHPAAEECETMLIDGIIYYVKKEPMKNKISYEDVEAVIVSEEYSKLGSKTTICLLTLKNGYELIGMSACVDPAEFDMEAGKKFARAKAVEQIWALEGYLLQQMKFVQAIHNAIENQFEYVGVKTECCAGTCSKE